MLFDLSHPHLYLKKMKMMRLTNQWRNGGSGRREGVICDEGQLGKEMTCYAMKLRYSELKMNPLYDQSTNQSITKNHNFIKIISYKKNTSTCDSYSSLGARESQ